MKNISNVHVLRVKYLGATNTKGSRIKIISERFKESITISYNYDFNNTLEIAENYLTKIGFNIISHAEMKNEYLIITDSFDSLKRVIKVTNVK